ncbi:BMP family ABC transporter substrate-binding protein [Deinococcus aquiradiocola]|uniref:ABC transporter substrate-binding protein n=1 Tax=Deinococcus aquiradiocola TaxID=393059 RepID=A0A917UU10_9DEIO|nr:BMP family ABC transporter substrate-binding protein [Deinococcus aquiradiocola]GGJ85180.1 ABC transporter substrate-binding protein [Deinococcus aquiradiocola]
MKASTPSKKSLTLALALGAGVAAVASTLNPAQAQTGSAKLKACFVYVGPRGDIGWTYAHDQARQAAEKALPWLETKYVESVQEGQALPAIDRLVADKCQVIFTTSFGYMDDTLAAAKKYPNVIFAHAAGYKRAPNMATYMADFYQIYYLNGLVAGALTKSGKVGFVGTFPIPELKRHLSAFALGVKAANPKAVVDVKWLNSWFDPAKTREASEALLSQGDDVLSSAEDSATGVQTAAARKVPTFSHYNSMYKFSPDYVVAGHIAHWDKIYIDFLTKVHSGTYTAKNLANVDYWSLMNTGAVESGADAGVAVNPKWVPQLKAAKMTVAGKTVSVYDRLMALTADMKSPKPTFDPFMGPIKDRNGIVRVPAGKVASVAELNSMGWIAPGVVGAVADEPKK